MCHVQQVNNLDLIKVARNGHGEACGHQNRQGNPDQFIYILLLTDHSGKHGQEQSGKKQGKLGSSLKYPEGLGIDPGLFFS